MGEEKQSFPLDITGTAVNVRRNLLSGGQIVSGLTNPESLEMRNPQHLEGLSGMSGGSGLGIEMQTPYPVVELSQQLAQDVHQRLRIDRLHHPQQQQQPQQRQEQQQEQQQQQQQRQQQRQQLEQEQRKQEEELQQQRQPHQQQQQEGTYSHGNNQDHSQPGSSQPPLFPPPPPTDQQRKGPTTVFICRLGQECVDDIYTHALQMFGLLEEFELPDGTAQIARRAYERKLLIQDKLRVITLKFRQLHRIYDKCNENCQSQGLEYVDIESLVPMKDGTDSKPDDKRMSEADQLACEERERLIEQIILRNRHIKDIIYHLRRLVFEVNVMLEMRLTF